MSPSHRITSVPTRAHPLARALYARMGQCRTTYQDVEAASGVKKSTFKAFRTTNAPGTNSIQAVLNAVGLQALCVPSIDILPAPLAAELRALGERHGIPVPIAEMVIVAASRLPLTKQPA